MGASEVITTSKLSPFSFSIDSLLAATVLHHELRLVTRNQKDFDYPGLEVVNPWG